MNDFWVTPVFLLFAAATAVQLAAWWALYARLAFYRAPRTAHRERPPVSVLVCARNEAPRLRANLPALL
ncbi:MAG: glycosyl transferase family 2, partial [Saprospiraceae bacterium]|nr:glycosyl transferase family 2 [Saprospiraceae bacterium]